MKKLGRNLLLSVAAVLVLLFGAVFAACGEKRVTLSFNTNGGTAVEAIETTPGAEIDFPTTEQEGYTFDGWYLTSDLSGEALSGKLTAPETDTTYYAKWTALPALTLELGGGTLASGKTTYYLAEGTNLFSFMQELKPEKADHQFGEWLNGETPLSSGVKMPAEGITLTAHWKLKYTVETYRQNLSLGETAADYERDAEVQTGYDYEGVTVNGRGEFSHFYYNEKLSTSVTLAEGSENVAKVYYDRETCTLFFNENTPEGGDVTGSMEEQMAPYEGTFTIPASGYYLQGYRLMGWATSVDGPVDFHAGDEIAVENSLVLYAVWDGDAYTDALGGLDCIFLDAEDDTVVYLQRNGLPEQSGVIDSDGYFTIAGDGDFVLKGKINEGRKTFSYLMDDLPGEYIFLDAYSSQVSYATVLEIAQYDSAKVTVYKQVYEEQEIDGETYQTPVIDDPEHPLAVIGGNYAVADGYWGQFGILTFTAADEPAEDYAEFASFNFQLGFGTLQNGEQISYFAMQGQEALNGSEGLYFMPSEDGMHFSYPFLSLDGFGGCVVVMSETQTITNHFYTPANYWNTHADAGDDELALWYYDYGQALDIVCRVSTAQAYTPDSDDPVTIGVWEWQDNMFGVYDYAAEDGSTERYVLDGYGGVTYFGKVLSSETDEEGNVTETLEYPEGKNTGTYSAQFLNYYTGYVDTDEGSLYADNWYQYNAITFAFEDGESKTFYIASTPIFGFSNGSLRKLGNFVGEYAVDNAPYNLHSEIYSDYHGGTSYLFNLRLALTGQTVTVNGEQHENGVAFWGDNGYNESFNGTYHDLSECVFEGYMTFKESSGGYEIYTITITSVPYAFRSVYSVNSTIDFYFTEDGTIVFLQDELTFKADDGNDVFTIDGFGKAHYSGAPDQEIEYVSSVYGTLGQVFFFTGYSEEEDAVFFRFTDGTVKEIHMETSYAELNYQASDNWNGSNLRNLDFYQGFLYVFQDNTALFIVGNTSGTSVYYSYGTIAALENGEEGEYSYTLTSGSVYASYSNMIFRYVEDGDDTYFVVRNSERLLSVQTKDGDETFTADGYGNGVYTDKNGTKHEGAVELVFLTRNGAIDPETLTYNRNYNESFFILTEENGTKWGIIVRRGSSTSSGFESFIPVASDATSAPFGIWWSLDDHRIGVTMYLNNGYVMYDWASNNSSMTAWVAVKDMQRQDDGSFTFKFKNTSGTERENENRFAFRHITADDNVTEWDVAYQYDADSKVYYQIVDDFGEVIGTIYNDGFSVSVYTDADDVEYSMAVSLLDTEAGILVVNYLRPDGSVGTMTFDLILTDEGETVAWLRTEAAYEAYLNTQQAVEENVIIAADGHGGAVLYSDVAEGVQVKGTVAAVEEYVYEFTSDDGTLTFRYYLYAVTDGNGSLVYYFYLAYDGAFTGFFYEETTFTTLFLDGYENASFRDPYGYGYEGTFNVLGEAKSVLEFYSASGSYTYYRISYGADGLPLRKLTLITDDFVTEGDTLLGYQGDGEIAQLPAGITKVGKAAFRGKALQNVTLNGVTEIAPYAFAEATAKSVSAPDVLAIAPYAFYQSGVEAVSAPKAESIGEYAFYECEVLASFTFDSVKTIAPYAFGYCMALTEANMPAIVTIDEFAFYYALALRTVEVGKDVTHLGAQVFFNVASMSSSRMKFYLHSTPQTDYDTLMGDMVFYQCETLLYVDSLDVAKAIYNSEMATQYRTTGYYEQYWEILRVLNKTTDEYGAYIPADYTKRTSSDGTLLRLDGQLTDRGFRSTSEYSNGVYEIDESGKMTVIFYDEAAENHYRTMENVSYDASTTMLTIGDLKWVRITEDVPALYENENGSTFELYGSISESSSTGALSLSNLRGIYTDTEGQKFESTARLTASTSSRVGYLQITVSSDFTTRVSLNKDMTFDVIYELLYYKDEGASYTSQLLMEYNIDTKETTWKIQQAPQAVSYYDETTGFVYQVSGTSNSSYRLNEKFDPETSTLTFRSRYNAYVNDITIYYNRATRIWVPTVKPVYTQAYMDFKAADGTLLNDNRYETVRLPLIVDFRTDTAQIVDFDLSNVRTAMIGSGSTSSSLTQVMTQGAYREDDGSFVFMIGSSYSHLAYRVVYTPDAKVKMTATLIESYAEVRKVEDGTTTVVYFQTDMNGNALGVLSLQISAPSASSQTLIIGSCVKTGNNAFTVIAGTGTTAANWKKYEITFKPQAGDTPADCTVTAKDDVFTITPRINGTDVGGTFLLDKDGNAVGVCTLYYKENEGGSLTQGRNLWAHTTENYSKFVVTVTNTSNAGRIIEVTYTPGEGDASATVMGGEVTKVARTAITSDGLNRVTFTTTTDGTIVGIANLQTRTSMTASFSTSTAAVDVKATGENAWTVTLSTNKVYTVTYDAASGTVTVAEVKD